jgi:sec-independent protein translocase protein TatB
MFDVGFSELFLLALIGLIVLGPERLPGVARTVGAFIRKARTSWNNLRQTIEAELDQPEIMDPIKRASEEFRRVGEKLREVPGSKREPAAKKPAADDLSDGGGSAPADQDSPQQAEDGKTRDD